jgi:excisionase family DNA binding protein
LINQRLIIYHNVCGCRSTGQEASMAREKVWLRVPEAAELLGLPRTRAYELIQQGELPAVRIGERSIRVNRAELERFLLESRRVVGTN